MGLTSQSTGANLLRDALDFPRAENDKIIVLAGNPNVGKSTVFNSLTGLSQHTGNWPGKTVSIAHGKCEFNGEELILVDIPGTYSLMANSAEEEVARDFIIFGNPDATVVVVDATCLERNLNLVLQTLEITHKVVLCLNLLDEAKKKKIAINVKELSRQLGIPVVGTSARTGEGLDKLMESVIKIISQNTYDTTAPLIYDPIIEQAIELIEPTIRKELPSDLNSRWVSIRLLDGDKTLIRSIEKYMGIDILENVEIADKLQTAREMLTDAGICHDLLRDKIVCRIIHKAEEISKKVVTYENEKYHLRDRKIDKVLTSRVFGIPIMLSLLGVIFWLTITGANYPSELLASGFSAAGEKLSDLLISIGTPVWFKELLMDGIYRTLAWVVSVMLPPMAIFFPLFTLLEDLGYLPRVAFNLDNFFKKACAHGKQALTMCMGFGCNAAGIVGCRIIDSPRERLIAIITNNFVPCNGRFPTLIAIITMFFAGAAAGFFQTVISTLILTAVIVLGVIMTLVISKLLSKTLLKGLPSSFTLELPPYRKPQIGKVIIRSIFDRTIFVLGRAVAVAAPAGLIIWCMANLTVGDKSLLSHCAGFLDPLGRLIGMDGFILMAFILGLPANEIVFPIIIMSYMATGSLTELDNLYQLRELLVSHGWTGITAICVMLFSLMHWPCGTTCWTIKKETQSWKWTLVSVLVPTITGFTICLIAASVARLLGLG